MRNFKRVLVALLVVFGMFMGGCALLNTKSNTDVYIENTYKTLDTIGSVYQTTMTVAGMLVALEVINNSDKEILIKYGQDFDKFYDKVVDGLVVLTTNKNDTKQIAQIDSDMSKLSENLKLIRLFISVKKDVVRDLQKKQQNNKPDVKNGLKSGKIQSF